MTGSAAPARALLVGAHPDDDACSSAGSEAYRVLDTA